MTINTSEKWKSKTLLFIISQCITLFGSSLVQFAMIWYVTFETSSGIWMTVLTLCSYLPQMLISFFAGVWTDRFNRKMLINIADAVIALASLLLALFVLSGNQEKYILIGIVVVSVIRSLGAGVQTPAVNAMLPQLVPEDKLMRINGINSSVQSMVQFAAPLAAGTILELGSIDGILFIDVGTAMIGIFVLCLLKIPVHNEVGIQGNSSHIGDVKAGITYIIRNKFIGKTLIIYGFFIFLSVPSGFLTALMIERLFGASYLYLSLNEMAGFAGMMLGGLFIGVWGGFKNRCKSLAFGVLFYGGFAVCLGLSKAFLLFTAFMFLISFSIPFVQSASMAILQEKVEQEMQGRVFSFMNIMFCGCMPLGMAVFGPLADLIPIDSMMITTGSVLFIFAILIFLSKRYYQQGMYIEKNQ